MEKCRNFKRCGGCQLPNLEYSEQLAYKQRQAEFLLGEFCAVNKIIGMENHLHYRNKATAAYFWDSKSKAMKAGIFQDKTKSIMPIDFCLLQDKKADEIVQTICRIAPSFKLKPYNKEKDTGNLRHTLIRSAFGTGEIMLVIVTASPKLHSERSFINALLASHPEITTIIHSINPDGEDLTLGKENRILHGKGYIEDTLCGYKFRISPASFYQINHAQTEVLYSKAIEFAELTGKETIFDAYCGTGTIGIIAAKHAHKAIGVEINKTAIEDAEINAKANEINNTSFYADDAAKYLSRAVKDGSRFDVIFMDPPRAGTTKQFINAAVKAAPKK